MNTNVKWKNNSFKLSTINFIENLRERNWITLKTAQLRKIISYIVRIFSCSDENLKLYERRPIGYSSQIDFQDPNNGTDKNPKTKLNQQQLIAMLRELFRVIKNYGVLYFTRDTFVTGLNISIVSTSNPFLSSEFYIEKEIFQVKIIR